MLQSLTIKT